MMLLRTFQAGKHAAAAGRLLNEVAAARLCLLNADKKAAYDHQLRSTLKPQLAGNAGSAGDETVDLTELRHTGHAAVLSYTL